jgi:hypothetical protein
MLVLLIVITTPLYVFASHREEHNLWRVLKPVPVERFLVYEAAIVPWLQREFSNKMFMNNGGIVKRGLIRSDLLRFEKIEEQDRYNVHIEYRVFIRDVSGVELTGLKGQEIVFYIHNGSVEDYFPFDEYWIEGVVLREEEFY